MTSLPPVLTPKVVMLRPTGVVGVDVKVEDAAGVGVADGKVVCVGVNVRVAVDNDVGVAVIAGEDVSVGVRLGATDGVEVATDPV
jgi:hypothetical protein